MPLHPPVLSLLDPVEGSEGSVDPLSLSRTYERLADRILPAVTVRMSRIRFVTAMCLGALVCEAFGNDAVASDGVTPPWLVYEWFVIEAFAREGEDTRGARIPGLLKVKNCLRAHRQVGAESYLKTPTVFGFTGIFRRLATKAKIVDEQLRLDDGGWELLRAWEREQELGGLIQGKQGAGAELRRELQDAVAKGLTAGSTVPRRSEFWARIARLLDPDGIDVDEGRVLLRWLRHSHALTSEHVDHIEKHGEYIGRDGEAEFLRETARWASTDLASHLTAIDAYEALCRPVERAFDLLRHISTTRSLGPVSAADFDASPGASTLVDELIRGCARALQDPNLLDWEPDARIVIDTFERVTTPRELFEAVVKHHEASQRRKPPDGKRPWIEHTRDSGVVVRPAYPLPQWNDVPPYVHDYRTGTLCGFLADTGRLA